MEAFAMTSPVETKGFTGRKYREILSCELGPDTTARISEIGLSGGGTVKWRLSGFDSVLDIPESPSDHKLEFPHHEEWDGNFKIEAAAAFGRVKPYAYIRGTVEEEGEWN